MGEESRGLHDLMPRRKQDAPIATSKWREIRQVADGPPVSKREAKRRVGLKRNPRHGRERGR